MRSVLILMVLVFLTSVVQARDPENAPKLGSSKGMIIHVSNVEQIYRILPTLQSNTTIVLRRGTYKLHRPIHLSGARRTNITIRGGTDNYQDVVIRGAGMNNKAVHHGILAENVEGLVIANLTIGWVGYHPIAMSPNCRKVHVYHCRLVDAGEQFIKASSNGKAGGADQGLVEYCVMEYTDSGPPNGYTNGVDVHGGKNWVIRHNLFRNIRTPAGAKYKAVPSVLMWNGAEGTICEGNTFINCDRAIAFGLVRRNGFLDHQGGIIRNNFIYSNPGEVQHIDTGIFVASPGTKILHNTVLLNGGYPNAIEVRWPLSKSVLVVNNLTDASIVSRDSAVMEATDNVTNARSEMFNAASNGDLHLSVDTLSAKPNVDCKLDWDGTTRSNSRVSVGAHERSR